MGPIETVLQNACESLDSSIKNRELERVFHRLPPHNMPTTGYIINIFMEMRYSRLFLEQILEQFANDEAALKIALRRFLKIRWALIMKSSAAYVELPISPINQICQKLALAIAEPEEPIAKILMPTIKIESYAINGDDLKSITENKQDRSLATHRFILTANGTAVINLSEWFNKQLDEDNKHHYWNYLYARGSDGRTDFLDQEAFHRRAKSTVPDLGDSEYAKYYRSFLDNPIPLSREDFELIKTSVMPVSKEYLDEAEAHIKMINTQGSLSQALDKLCDDCFNNGVYGTGTEARPHDNFYPRLRDFLNGPWRGVMAADKQKILAVKNPSDTKYDFESYLLVLRAGCPDETLTPNEIAKLKRDNLITCIDLAGKNIRRVMNSQPNLFSGVKTGRQPLDPLLETVKALLPESASVNSQRYSASEKRFEACSEYYFGCLYGDPIPNVNALSLYYAGMTEAEFISMLTATNAKVDLDVALKWAVENKQPDLISLLVKHGASLCVGYTNSQDEYFNHLFHLATYHDWTQVIDACLDRNDYEYDRPGIQNWTFLHYAVRKDRTRIVEKLLAKGANVNIQTILQCTALHLAAFMGNIEIVRLLLSKEEISQSINLINDDGKTPLQEAFTANHLDIVILLIQHGADFSGEFGPKKQSLLAWAVENNKVDLISALVKRGANLLVQYSHPSYPESHHLFNLAIALEWSQVIDACLAREDFECNTRSLKGWTHLHFAVCANQANVVEKLLVKGAEVNARFEDKWTALYLAFAKNYLDIALLLIEHGADFSDLFGPQKLPLIHFAATENRLKGIMMACFNQTSVEDLCSMTEAAREAILNALFGNEEELNTICQNPDQKAKIQALAFSGIKLPLENLAARVEQLINHEIISDQDTLLAHPQADNLLGYYGFDNLCRLGQIEVGSEAALKLFAHAVACGISHNDPQNNQAREIERAIQGGTTAPILHLLRNNQSSNVGIPNTWSGRFSHISRAFNLYRSSGLDLSTSWSVAKVPESLNRLMDIY